MNYYDEPVAPRDEDYAIVRTDRITRETEKAILIENGMGGVWLPKSKIEMVDLRGLAEMDMVMLVIPGWLCRKNSRNLAPAASCWVAGEDIRWIEQQGFRQWYFETYGRAFAA